MFGHFLYNRKKNKKIAKAANSLTYCVIRLAAPSIPPEYTLRVDSESVVFPYARDTFRQKLRGSQVPKYHF